MGHNRTHAPQLTSGRAYSLSCTCLPSALLTNSTESMAAPSWMRNSWIASFIGGSEPRRLVIAEHPKDEASHSYRRDPRVVLALVAA